MRWTLLLALLSGPAAAGSFVVMSSTSEVLLSVRGGPDFGYEIFRLSPGGCLRGPLEFKDEAGRAKFALGAGNDYPSGCSK